MERTTTYRPATVRRHQAITAQLRAECDRLIRERHELTAEWQSKLTTHESAQGAIDELCAPFWRSWEENMRTATEVTENVDRMKENTHRADSLNARYGKEMTRIANYWRRTLVWEVPA